MESAQRAYSNIGVTVCQLQKNGLDDGVYPVPSYTRYTSRCWKLRVFNGFYPDGDRFPYHDLLDCDRICTTIDSSVKLSVPVMLPNLLVGAIE